MNNDDTRATQIAQDRERFQQEKLAWEWLQDHMPREVRAALDRFLTINPSFTGAEWWDVLSILRDSDSHLDVIEPMSEVMDEWNVLQSFVVLTMLYASRDFAINWSTEQRIVVVRATIANNGGGL